MDPTRRSVLLSIVAALLIPTSACIQVTDSDQRVIELPTGDPRTSLGTAATNR